MKQSSFYITARALSPAQTLTTNQKCRDLTAIPAIVLMAVCGLFLSAGQKTLAAGPQCTAPYVQVQGLGTAPLGGDPTGTLQIQSVSIGEPFDGNCNGKSITLVMKVSTLDPANSGMVAAPYNQKWLIGFTVPDTNSIPRTVVVEWNTQTVPTGAFGFGFVDTSTGQNINRTTNCAISACPVTGTVSPNGTITMKLDISSTFTFAPATGSPILVNIPGAGTNLSAIQGTTYTCACAAGSGVIVTQSQTPGNGAYTLLGNLSCSAPPVAGLTATPTMGPAPLNVMFNASTSNIPLGGCGTISSYIFDFGDSTGVTQPTSTTSHIYSGAGAYPATVRVVSSVGLTSALAQQNITVTSVLPPALSSVVSRMTHGGTTDFDIVLPQPPATRSVECRNSGGNYKMVLTFVHDLVSVASASVTTGSGSVASGVLGPNSNQYTVNLTGVTNAQNVTVTLNSAVDSIGASGNVPVVMGVLIGDTTNDGSVNSADIGQTKSRSGVPIDGVNFRSDVNLDATLNSADIGLVKSKSGTAIP